MSRIVVALGGNALIRRGECGSTDTQRHNLRAAAVALHGLIREGHELVISHGNGPQVGFLSIEAEAARDTVPAPPMDVLVAESQGQIGYLLAQTLEAELATCGDHRPIAVVISQTIVDPDDPAFQRPSKPVGPVYDLATAEELARKRGWAIGADGTGWRRVVASPRPLEIVEALSIRTLVNAGVIVVAAGGGGIPVFRLASGLLAGIEAVVDKDHAAVLLAEAVEADALLLLTDVHGVYRSWGTSRGNRIGRLTPETAMRGVHSGAFAAGSMGPKVEAAAEFVRRTGGFAAIGALEDAEAVLAGRAGTRIEVEAGFDSR
ncbi:MAG TPA: carbamate kinase [Candidatus Limnocylindrales bacterium]|jgi:carbamate kinase